MSKSSQKNTLLNYFGKSPQQGHASPKIPAASSPALAGSPPPRATPQRSTLTSANTETPRLKVKRGSLEPTPKNAQRQLDTYGESELVWAKLDGYPWWPSLIYPHPVRKAIRQGRRVHVQFFDHPPTRSWIDERFVKPYLGAHKFEELGVSKPKDDDWERACREADAAMALSSEERRNLITCQEPSDEENSWLEEEATPKTARHKKTRSKEGPTPKRRRISPTDSEEEGDEYRPEAISESEDSTADDGEGSAPEADEEEGSPVARKRKTPVAANDKSCTTPSRFLSFSTDSPAVSQGTKKKLSEFSCRDAEVSGGHGRGDGRSFSHLALDWLKPEKIRDANRRKPEDPDYDPRTLFVPDSFKQNLTPAMRQWWEMKSRHYDVIIFFKVGKFYELYHMDALIAVKELGIILMKGDHAHCGFPERGFAKHSALLIERGYKVARVEQTETPEMCNERLKATPRATKFDKVVQREVCQITSLGTRTYNVMEGDNWQVDHQFLLALWEKGVAEGVGGKVSFGVAFVDTSIGNFFIGQFEDDRYRSRLSTLLTRYHPVEIISARRTVSSDTRQAWTSSCPNALHETIHPSAECWDASKTLRSLAEGDYFKADGELDWPEGVRHLLDGGSTVGLVAKEEFESAVRALGALVWYLKECQLDQELLSRRRFQMYTPLDDGPLGDAPVFGRHMILDGVTLRNLDVLANSSLGTFQGSLLERLNRCNTAFGQRQLRHWLCAPLCNPAAIEDRLDAVEYLANNPSASEEVGKILKGLPDLERLVNKIHGQGSSLKARNHPDSRAVFFDAPVYSKKRIADFILTLDGFRAAQKVEEYFRPKQIGSKLLTKAVKSEERGGDFPDTSEHLEFFRHAFDHEEAAKEGKMIPRPGVDREYDRALDCIAEVQAEADRYLLQQKVHFGCKVVYFGTNRNRFQIEVPESAVKRADKSYEIQGSRKGFKRFYTNETRGFLQRTMAAEDQRDTALKDISRRIFEQFDQRHSMWEKVVDCLAVLDILMAMAAYASDQKMCRPRIVVPSSGQQPYLRLIQGRHPAHSQLFVNNDFIPNDVHLGSPTEDDAPHSLTLVTGPNMGGKSTLMRQVGLCVILAQMGSFVPAEELELTPVDRLFTRLGASDHILGGESTFFVELSETAAILKHVSAHSLVLLDELGRGTATFDGTAIAYSVVDHLADRRCRTLFSTHYHSLVHDLASHPRVRLGHMACMVENDEGVDDPTQENIVFLYQFVSGACPKSYGFHAARLAGLDRGIIARGFRRAKEMEAKMTSVQVFRDLYQPRSVKPREVNWSCLVE